MSFCPKRNCTKPVQQHQNWDLQANPCLQSFLECGIEVATASIRYNLCNHCQDWCIDGNLHKSYQTAKPRPIRKCVLLTQHVYTATHAVSTSEMNIIASSSVLASSSRAPAKSASELADTGPTIMAMSVKDVLRRKTREAARRKDQPRKSLQTARAMSWGRREARSGTGNNVGQLPFRDDWYRGWNACLIATKPLPLAKLVNDQRIGCWTTWRSTKRCSVAIGRNETAISQCSQGEHFTYLFAELSTPVTCVLDISTGHAEVMANYWQTRPCH